MIRSDMMLPITLLALLIGCSQNSRTTAPTGANSQSVAADSSDQSPEASNASASTDTGTSDVSTIVTAMDGRVTVDFPAAPTHEQRTVEANVGPVSFDSYKAQSNGVFWNLLITTYPPSVVAGSQDPIAFLRTRAEGNEKQKTGATRDSFKELEESEYWAAEHRFTYPKGTNSEGGNYDAGFALHRYYLVETSVVAVFVDVADSVYDAQSKSIDDAIDRFFSSLAIRDQ